MSQTQHTQDVIFSDVFDSEKKAHNYEHFIRDEKCRDFYLLDEFDPDAYLDLLNYQQHSRPIHRIRCPQPLP